MSNIEVHTDEKSCVDLSDMKEAPHWSNEELQALYTSVEFTSRYIYATEAITDMLRALEGDVQLFERLKDAIATKSLSSWTGIGADLLRMQCHKYGHSGSSARLTLMIVAQLVRKSPQRVLAELSSPEVN